MDNFVVSARKYRPQRFEDVVGQQSIADTLKLAIKNQKLASAYLFCGPRGVGKTTCARIFAKAINCLDPHADGEACEQCDSCISFNEQRSVNIQELNAAANNSVEDIRAIIEQVRIPPQLGKYKVIILDEVHMLSQAAGNALLKTLEEPPSYVIFILATTEKQKIMQTILSRCQIFDFNRMEIGDIVSNLRMIAQNEGITAHDDALNLIAQKADGGMRDALSVFDQVNNFAQGNITRESVLQCINALDSEYYFRMTDLLVEHNVVESMVLFNDIVNKGFSGGVFIGGLASHMRDLLMSRDPATLPLLDAAEELKARYAAQAQKCSVKFLYHAIRICDRCSNEYKTSYNKRLSVELTLIEAAQHDDDDPAGAGHRPTKKLKPIFSSPEDCPAPKSASGHSAPQQQNEQAKAQSEPAAQLAKNESTVSATPAQPKAIGRVRVGLLKGALAKARTTIGESAPTENGTDEKKAVPCAAESVTDNVSDKTAAPADIAPRANDTPPVEENESLADDDITASEGEEQSDGSAAAEDNIIVFTDAEVDRQWTKYALKLQQDDPVMSSRMQAMPLKCLENNTIEVSLHNDMVQRQIQQHLPAIEEFMRNAFNLPDIKIQTKVLPAEIVRVITNPAELLDKMRNDNPHFADFVDKMNLQLA